MNLKRGDIINSDANRDQFWRKGAFVVVIEVYQDKILLRESVLHYESYYDTGFRTMRNYIHNDRVVLKETFKEFQLLTIEEAEERCFEVALHETPEQFHSIDKLLKIAKYLQSQKDSTFKQLLRKLKRFIWYTETYNV